MYAADYAARLPPGLWMCSACPTLCKFSLTAQKGSTFDHHFSGTLQAVFSFMAYSNAISAPTSRDTPHKEKGGSSSRSLARLIAFHSLLRPSPLFPRSLLASDPGMHCIPCNWENVVRRNSLRVTGPYSWKGFAAQQIILFGKKNQQKPQHKDLKQKCKPFLVIFIRFEAFVSPNNCKLLC